MFHLDITVETHVENSTESLNICYIKKNGKAIPVTGREGP
jgi:hypothetical protein